jgi:hypothetical protein
VIFICATYGRVEANGVIVGNASGQVLLALGMATLTQISFLI